MQISQQSAWGNNRLLTEVAGSKWPWGAHVGRQEAAAGSACQVGCTHISILDNIGMFELFCKKRRACYCTCSGTVITLYLEKLPKRDQKMYLKKSYVEPMSSLVGASLSGRRTVRWHSISYLWAVWREPASPADALSADTVFLTCEQSGGSQPLRQTHCPLTQYPLPVSSLAGASISGRRTVRWHSIPCRSSWDPGSQLKREDRICQNIK